MMCGAAAKAPRLPVKASPPSRVNGAEAPASVCALESPTSPLVRGRVGANRRARAARDRDEAQAPVGSPDEGVREHGTAGRGRSGQRRVPAAHGRRGGRRRRASAEGEQQQQQQEGRGQEGFERGPLRLPARQVRAFGRGGRGEGASEGREEDEEEGEIQEVQEEHGQGSALQLEVSAGGLAELDSRLLHSHGEHPHPRPAQDQAPGLRKHISVEDS